MRCLSTRGRAPAVPIAEALLAGLAPDGGLYVPERLPRLAPAAVAGATGLDQLAARLLAPFFAEDRLGPELPPICREAFAFPAPLRPLDGESFLLELFHGPTGAFKDFAARFLAAAWRRLRAPGEEVLLLVATSGDTGAAVADAFHGLAGFRVAVLYPEGRVSPRQAAHLEGFGGNVRCFRVAGSFDDCQRLARSLLAKPGRAPSGTRLSSANSISLGRLLPQLVYHAAAALAHWRERQRPLGLVVPTGNLGNALAAVIARAMGLPIGTIVLAVNENRTLAEFLGGGAYRPRATVPTLASAMDVGAPSNLERLRHWFPDPRALRAALAAEAVADEEIREEIARAAREHGLAVCPHTAAGLRVLRRLRAAGERAPFAVAATAHPAKFAEIVEPLIGEAVPVPPALAAAWRRPPRSERLEATPEALRAALGLQ